MNVICPCDVDTPMLEYQAREFGGGDPKDDAQAEIVDPQGARERFAEPRRLQRSSLAVPRRARAHHWRGTADRLSETDHRALRRSARPLA